MLMQRAWVTHHHCLLALLQSVMGGADINLNEQKKENKKKILVYPILMQCFAWSQAQGAADWDDDEWDDDHAGGGWDDDDDDNMGGPDENGADNEMVGLGSPMRPCALANERFDGRTPGGTLSYEELCRAHVEACVQVRGGDIKTNI